MVPTSRGEELRLPLRRALEELSRALARPEAFDPAKAERRVRVATSDYCEIVLLPRLLSRLDAEAPGIELRVVPYHDDVPGMLAAGEADVVLAPVGPTDDAPGIFSKKLFDETFVCVVRRGHPLASKRLTAAAYAGARHALISPRGKEGGFVDDALAKLGLRRRVVVTVPHFLVAPHVVASCDLVLTLASRVATLLAEPLGLVVLGPPADLRLAGFRVSSIWHERTHGDPAHAWLRGLIADVAVGI
jgi:DNA-binding transcriptional LysR family regulator